MNFRNKNIGKMCGHSKFSLKIQSEFKGIRMRRLQKETIATGSQIHLSDHTRANATDLFLIEILLEGNSQNLLHLLPAILSHCYCQKVLYILPNFSW